MVMKSSYRNETFQLLQETRDGADRKNHTCKHYFMHLMEPSTFTLLPTISK